MEDDMSDRRRGGSAESKRRRRGGASSSSSSRVCGQGGAGGRPASSIWLLVGRAADPRPPALSPSELRLPDISLEHRLPAVIRNASWP